MYKNMVLSTSFDDMFEVVFVDVIIDVYMIDLCSDLVYCYDDCFR